MEHLKWQNDSMQRQTQTAEAISYTPGFKKTGSFFHKLVELEIYT